MKISIFVSSLKGGGAERVMLYLAEGFAQQGHQVQLIVARHEGSYLNQLPDNLRVVPLTQTLRLRRAIDCLLRAPRQFFKCGLKLPRFLTLFSAVREHIESYQPDAMITALHSCNLSAALAKSCTRHSFQLIITEHIALSSFIESVPSRRNKLLPFIKQLYPVADHIVAVSDGVKYDLAELTGIPANQITTIFNPVITPKVLEKINEPMTDLWRVPEGTYKVLAAAG